ncbi:hypothetical protein ACLUWO_08740 [Pseudoscardovia radai]|uniref:hypothetical protein n=1 Tax=Pseudoscardovia radai TaxID=987066 RepID=UPI003995F72C
MVATQTNRYSTNIPQISCQTGELGTDFHPWEQRQLGEVVIRRSAQAISTEDMPSVEYEDVEAGRGALTRDFTSKEGKRGICFEPGDVLYGKLRPYLGNRLKPAFRGVAVGDWWVLEPSSVASSFLFSLIQSPRFITVANQSSGSKMPRADWKLVGSAAFGIPPLPEQRRIGVFFSTLDNLIAAAERQEALLRQKKQAYLQLMFPQEGEAQPRLKFNGFSGEWESLQLGKLYEKNTERNGNQFDAGKTLSVSSMTFNAFGNGAAEESLTTYKVLRIGDAAFEGHTSNEFAFGRFVVNTIGDGIMSPRFTAIRPTARWRQSCDLDFWSCYLHDENVMKRILVRSTKRGTMMNELVLDDFFTERIRVPSLPEQRLIGRFFATLASLIAASGKRTASLRALKSAYLQRMFV